MARVDHVKQRHIKAKKEAFTKLMNSLRHSEEFESLTEVTDKHLAWEAIRDLEKKVEEQSKEINEYKGFFNVLYKFLPKKHIPPTVFR